MIGELIDNYGNFHDALVLNVEYKTNIDLIDNIFKSGKKEVILIISCFNQLKDFERNIIKIRLTDIEEFRHVKYDGMINNTFNQIENDFITLDFDPILTSDNQGNLITKKNLNSDLLIKFKKLEYQKIE